jgi:hypothetical protein
LGLGRITLSGLEQLNLKVQAVSKIDLKPYLPLPHSQELAIALEALWHTYTLTFQDAERCPKGSTLG